MTLPLCQAGRFLESQAPLFWLKKIKEIEFYSCPLLIPRATSALVSPERSAKISWRFVGSFLPFILPDPGAGEASTRKCLAFQKLSLLLASDRFPSGSLPGSGGPLAVGDPSPPCPALSRWQREGRGEPVPRAPRTAPRVPDRRGPPPASVRGAGVLGGEPLGSLGSAPAASQTCLVASPLGAWVSSDKTICVLPGSSQCLSRLSPLLSLRGPEGLPVWPRGTVGGVLGAERESCRRTPWGRSEKKAGGAPWAAAGPGRWGGRTSARRAQGQGEGTRPRPGAPRPRRGVRTRIGRQAPSSAPALEPPPLARRLPAASPAPPSPLPFPSGVPGAAEPTAGPPQLSAGRPGEADSGGGGGSGVSPGLRPRSADPGFAARPPAG